MVAQLEEQLSCKQLVVSSTLTRRAKPYPVRTGTVTDNSGTPGSDVQIVGRKTECNGKHAGKEPYELVNP